MSKKDIVWGKLNELYRYRYMFFSIVKRNLTGKYKNSALGFLWNFITPAVSVILFYIVFSNFMGRDIPNYWAYLSLGVFSFTFLNENIIGGSSVIINNSNMIKKIYFPTEIVMMAQVAYSFTIFLISYIIIIVLMAVTGAFVNLDGIIAFLPIIIFMFMFSLGTTLFLSSITVYVRDLQHLITAFARILFWITPIFYMANAVSGILSKIIWLNPLTYYIESLRSIFYYGVMPTPELFLISGICGLTMLLLGIVVFYSLKKGFSERI
jgi:lipopolysaccharide transport system permease protein